VLDVLCFRQPIDPLLRRAPGRPSNRPDQPRYSSCISALRWSLRRPVHATPALRTLPAGDC